MTIGQIDLVEISEAFAAQVIPLAKQMGIAMETLNIHNGAIALGHPFGMTGAHIITTLIYGLQHTDKGIGLEPMCVGGGQGMAMIIERLNKFRYLALYGIQVSLCMMPPIAVIAPIPIATMKKVVNAPYAP